jgi:DNA-directed RNA polymerase specialized sigma24 family protein
MTAALAAVRRFPNAAELSPEPWCDGPAGEPFLGLLPAEQGQLLAEGLDALPIEQARAVRAHLAGFSHEDVARLYGWTAAAARHRIYRGLDRLRTVLRGRRKP